MSLTLAQVLKLVGQLDDTPGSDTPRERFRAFLLQNVTSAGQLRDFVQECRVASDLQHSRALQDLTNHAGALLGFELARYVRREYQAAPVHLFVSGRCSPQTMKGPFDASLFESELPEILGMSDRVAVMRRGTISGILSRDEATSDKILALALEETRAGSSSATLGTEGTEGTRGT